MVNLGSGGNKYLVQFSIGGTGKKDLQDIGNLFGKVNKSMNLSNSYHLERIFDRVESFGESMAEVGSSIFKGYEGAFEKLIDKGAQFEQMILAIEATGKTGDQARGMLNDMIKLTSELPITEAAAADILTGLSTVHIDAFKSMGDSFDALAKKGKTLPDLPKMLGVDRMATEGPKVITVVTDMLAATRNLGTQYQDRAIQEMMLFLQGGAPRAPKTFKQFNGEIHELGKRTKDAGQRLEGLYEILGKHGALGASVAAMFTWQGVMSQYKGLFDRLTNAVMQPSKVGGLQDKFVKMFSKLYFQIIDYFDEATPKGQKFLATLRELTSWLTTMVEGAVERFGKALKYAMEWISKHPLLTKFAVGLSLVAAAALVVGGAMVALAAGVATVAVSMAVLQAAILPMLPSLAAVATAIGLIGTAFALYESDFAGVKSSFEKITTLFDGLSEAYDNWAGSTTKISKETGDKLQKAGMLGVFLDIVGAIREAEVTWKSFTQEMDANGQTPLDKIRNGWQNIEDAAGRVWEAIKIVAVALGLIPNTTKDSFDQATKSGKGFADDLVKMANVIAETFNNMAVVIDMVTPSVANMVVVFTDLAGVIRDIWNILQLVFDVMQGIGGAIVHIVAATGGMGISLMQRIFGDGAGAQETEAKLNDHLAGMWKRIGASFGEDIGDIQDAGAASERARTIAERIRLGSPPGASPGHPNVVLPGTAVDLPWQPGDLTSATGSLFPTAEGPSGTAATPEAPRVAAPKPAPIHVNLTLNNIMDGTVVSSQVIKKTIQQQERAGELTSHE